MAITTFIFTGMLSAVFGESPLHIATGFGLTIVILAASTGHFSGGHMNPAVTIGLFAAGKIPAVRLLYVPVHLVGGIAAAALLKTLFIGQDTPPMVEPVNAISRFIKPGEGVWLELFFTALLVTVVLATTNEDAGFGSTAPLYIGFTVLIAHLVLVPFTGCGINPARSFGPALIFNEWDDHWVYWVGPLGGAVIVGLLERVSRRFLWPVDPAHPAVQAAAGSVGQPAELGLQGPVGGASYPYQYTSASLAPSQQYPGGMLPVGSGSIHQLPSGGSPMLGSSSPLVGTSLLVPAPASPTPSSSPILGGSPVGWYGYPTTDAPMVPVVL
eukprot:TRINITY_DN65363_c0_g1_i2.p1 TRINITY_DN65363_c0_g1~~TRINITY_DN65363_c0_g1_i2.p1  ORF type:complete len:327 (-),score=36.26 TRINITY_DN65363_c0_g1_i2:292-1272(-)